MWYWLFKYIFLGPLLALLGRPKVEGLEYVPQSGPAILASNHLAVMDSFYLSAGGAAPDHVPGEVGILHRNRDQGLVQPLVLHRRRPGADRPQ